MGKQELVEILLAESPDSPPGARQGVGWDSPLPNPQEQCPRLHLQVGGSLGSGKPIELRWPIDCVCI